MYFPGLSKDNVLFRRDICLNSEPKHVESYEETCKQMPANTVTLFGRQISFQVCPAKGQSCGSSDGWLRRNSKGPMRDIDLRLPADQHIYKSDKRVELRNFCSSQDTVKLDLATRLQAKQSETLMRNWFYKRNPETLIDLEEPPTWVSQKQTEPVRSASPVVPVSCLGRRHEPQESVSSAHTILKIPEAAQSPMDNDGCCQKKEISDEGYEAGNGEKTTDNMSLKQGLSSCAPVALDLNETPIDDLGMGTGHYFLQDLNYPYIEDTQMSCEKSEVEDPTPFCSPQSQNVHKINNSEKDGTTSPDSYTSCCITTDNSRTESRSSSPRTPGPNCRTRLEYPVTDASPGEPKDRCFDKEDSCDIDTSVQMAAESLVHIAFKSSSQTQDFVSKPELASDSSFQDQGFSSRPESGSAEPECSCDSYELLTLELSETGPDEYSASSKASDELSIVDNNKDFGFKLRRGRRMKNFQKEILPGLASLSRHEIREDINILEAVLRSKEYKKMQGKMAEGSNRLGTNPRNRRSGPKCVGRRRRRSE